MIIDFALRQQHCDTCSCLQRGDMPVLIALRKMPSNVRLRRVERLSYSTVCSWIRLTARG